MRVFYSDTFTFPLGGKHRFPMGKYGALREAIEAAALVPPGDMHVPGPATDEQLQRVHDPDYLRRLFAGELTPLEIRRIGLPWSPALVTRARYTVGGTIGACRAALVDGIAANLAGGTHHASRDQGQGFCLLNDVVIAIRAMQDEGRIRSAMVIDCDAHQGNGTADMTRGDPAVFTFSIHAESNFPLFKKPSSLDIGLADDTGDEAYLAALVQGLDIAFERARADLAFYIAGADPHQDDSLGHLALSFAGLAARDRLVLERCRAQRLPVVVLLGGGYGRRVENVVAIHLATLRIAAELARDWPPPRVRA